ncbi:NADPH-dependent FMN reductase [Luteibacter yeojuensis]|uniref:ACP phosphodiesterase n=1 Tax=Luteibacter yeojuensis TaxID=345309 RepID=A0A0F3L191_9GAMM|nr:NADPH-dependent FMN reductase [Luteibacter yeojuensis]KJV36114.1 ACP phosphodiesterase [Luteibacter yeojuensis]
MALPRHRIAILVGSLRRDSINRRIANSLAAFTQEWLDCEIIDIGGLPHYNQDEEADPPPSVVRFRDQVRPMDGVLFVTPEYNRGVPGFLKNAIDTGSRPYGQSVWDKKPAAIVTAAPGSIGGFGANHHLRQYCVFLNMPLMQQPEAYLARVTDESFDAEGCLVDGPLKDLVVQVGHAFAGWIDLIVRGRKLLETDAAHRST